MSKASHQPKLMRNLKGLKTISMWDVHPRESGMLEWKHLQLSCDSQPEQLLNSGLTGALTNTMVFSQGNHRPQYLSKTRAD